MRWLSNQTRPTHHYNISKTVARYNHAPIYVLWKADINNILKYRASRGASDLGITWDKDR